MADIAKKGANHSHSWWWDSHISPKHSRWLKGNLEDMDLKVREMLKLIEQDADSFAKRAEMFYKKRPEIISLLEEFYRGYRAVAERYDRAVGEINNGQTDVADLSPLKMKQANEAVSPRKPLRGALRKNLKEINASKQEDREFSTDTEVKSNENPSLKVPPQSPRANKIEASSQSKLQKDLFKAQQQIEVLKQDCARGAEQFSIIEVTMIKLQDIIRITKEENLKLKGESAFYKNKISELEGQIKMPKKENVELIEKGNIDVLVEEEKDKSDLYVQRQQMSSLSESLITQPDTPHKYLTQEPAHEGKMFATLEDKLLHCQLENSNLRMQVMSQSQQLQRVNEENENFHQAFLASQVEKNSLAFQYQQYVQLYETSENKLKELQLKLAVMLGGNGQLKGDTEEGGRFISQDDSVYRLRRGNSSPSECLSRNSDDLDRRVQMQESSNQIVSLDAILNNYRILLGQSQEQQKFMSAELYVKNEKLKDVDRRIKILEEEIEHLQKENGNLKEKSSAAVLSVKNLEQEVNRLREENSKLFSEVSFRVDQRDVLQQELYCLKEDRNDLDRKYHVIMKEMQLLGLDVENFSSACSSLQVLRQKLNVLFESTGENSVNINGVLQNVEELMHRNKTLENSISSLISDSKKHAYQLKLLEQVNESFQKEKVELIVEAEKYKDKVRVLEGQLEEFYSASNILRVENKSISDKLSEAREKVMDLESQAGNWLTEKETFQDEISRCNMVLSSLENEVESLKAEGRDLKKMLEEETAKVQMSAAKMDNLQSEMHEMNKKNQCLSEENVRLLKLCGASKETETELQTSLFNKQREHDILLQQFSFAMQFKKNLEVEIGKLQKFVADQEGDVVETNSGSVDGIRLLQTVSQKLTDYQAKLAYQMEENSMLFDKMSSRDVEVEKLKKDVLDMSLERTLAEDALASTLQKLSDLEKELERWEKAATAMEQKVEDGVARERNLSSDLQILQEALTSSESTKSALEEEHAMVLAKYESSKTCLDKRESIVSKIENDHKSLLIESLSDGFLTTILGNIIAEKEEEVHWLREQLAVLQRVSEIEKDRLEIPAAKLDIQEVESQQFTESIYGSQEDDEPQSDEDGEFSLTSPVNYTEFEIQTGDERVKEIRDYESRNNLQEKELENHLATGNKEYELMFEDADTERRNSGFMILEFNKDGKALRNGVQSSTKNIEEEGFENKDSNYLQLDMLKVEENTCETENRTKHVRHLEEQVRELIDTVRDLQQENSSLKGERSTESGDTGSLRMKERQYGKSQTSESLTIEGATNAQEKEVIVHEVNTVTAAEDRVNHEIELLQEQNSKVGTRFDSMTQQMRRMQHTFESLQQQFWRMRQDSNTSPKNANTTWAKNNALAKQFRELQNEVLFWLELNDLLKQEVQYRFVSLNRVNLEIAAIMSEAKSGEASVSCSSELQTKFNDIQEENMKIAEMLQLGADRARALEFQVEEILLKFQGQNQMFIPVQNLKTPNSEKIRVPLRTYIFGKKEQRKKRGTCFCTQPHTHD